MDDLDLIFLDYDELRLLLHEIQVEQVRDEVEHQTDDYLENDEMRTAKTVDIEQHQKTLDEVDDEVESRGLEHDYYCLHQF